MSHHDTTENTDGSRTRHHVTTVDECPPGERRIIDIEGREIAVFNVDGEFHALANYCVHQGGPLCEGMTAGTVRATDTTDEGWDWEYCNEGEIISCPWHGWEFDITSGEHLAQTGYRTPTYDVEVDGDDVYVRL